MTANSLNTKKDDIQINRSLNDERSKASSAIVIGASLAGLMTGIALSKIGMKVTILERASRDRRSGAVLQVDSGEADSTEIARSLRKLASGGIRSAEAWSSIEERLRSAVESTAQIELLYDSKVQNVNQDESTVFALTNQGREFSADILVGADGYRSIVRPHVAAQKSYSIFAGYMIWVGLVDERDIPEKYRPNSTPPLAMPSGIGDFLLGSFVSGKDGSIKKGDRRLGWAWYDNTKNELLRKLGCVIEDQVIHSLNGPDIPEATLTELTKKAFDRWNQPWLATILHSIESKKLTGIPISEYVPDTLVNGRIVLVGDAAHVPTPLTASGFNASLQDAATLANCFDDMSDHNTTTVLAQYESLRLKQAQQIVLAGQSFSRSFSK
jgi:2-polyprenyl-6-methoxyphenol hydroxylase-like FAD-dependent oxidoreductase